MQFKMNLTLILQAGISLNKHQTIFDSTSSRLDDNFSNMFYNN